MCSQHETAEILLKAMEDVGKPAFIHNTALNSNINKRMTKTTVNQNHIWTNIFVIADATCFDLFTNTVVTGGPFIRLSNYASQRGTIP